MSVPDGNMAFMAEDDLWRPLGFDLDAEATTYDALHDGVPLWMAESFWAWIEGFFVYRSSGHAAAFQLTLLRECERVCRFSTGIVSSSPSDGMRVLRNSVVGRELRLVDYLISRGQVDQWKRDGLEKILLESGS